MFARHFSLLAAATVIFCSVFSFASVLELNPKGCGPEKKADSVLYRKHFGEWNFTPEKMQEYFAQLYKSEMRLKDRAWVEDGKIYVEYTANGHPAKVKVPEKFVTNLSKMFTQALAKKYAEHIFFPDMGHNHFYLPKAENARLKNSLEKMGDVEKIQALLNNDNLRMMFHTSEQLGSTKKMQVNPMADEQGRNWVWRNLNRYIVGSNIENYPLEVFKEDGDFTALGYVGVVGGVYFSSNKNGCFAYSRRGKKLYFDITLTPYGADPNDPPIESED